VTPREPASPHRPPSAPSLPEKVVAIHERLDAGPFGEATLPILSPEHLAVCKAMFDRTKDWLDIEQILVATDPIDLAEIEAWLRRMVGESDPRLVKLEEIKARLALGGS